MIFIVTVKTLRKNTLSFGRLNTYDLNVLKDDLCFHGRLALSKALFLAGKRLLKKTIIASHEDSFIYSD